MKVAVAHPNIALVKYWGKSDATKNIPATPSLSVTLSDLYVTTAVEETTTDDIVLNDIGVEDQKLTTWLSRFRRAFRAPPVRVISHGNFPARSGLASSAAGFAALVTILNEHFQLELNKSELDEWARLGSASAARSLYGGFVTLQPRTNDCEVQTIKTAEDWPLAVIVAITSTHAKTISSSVGMMRTANTSPYYTAWLNSTRNDFVECVSAVETKDFDKLANISERSCRKMHALMLSTEPPLIYWNPTTLAGIQLIHDLRNDGVPVFFTVDAGSQLKAICLPTHAELVEAELKALNGVQRTIRCEIGGGAICADVEASPH